MISYIVHSNFIGEYQFYEDKQEFYGCILGIEPVIDFCGRTKEELKQSFIEGIESYIEEFNVDKGFEELLIV